jgi:hypothetical protein
VLSAKPVTARKKVVEESQAKAGVVIAAHAESSSRNSGRAAPHGYGRSSCPDRLDAHERRLTGLAPHVPAPTPRDRRVADTFDDLRRSTDMRQLAFIQSHELLRAEAFGCFSSQTRGAVQILERNITSGPADGME